MTQPSEQQVMETLRAIRDPAGGGDIVALGMVSGIVVRGGNVGFTIEVDPARGPALEPLRKAAEEAVRKLPGVLSVTAVLTAHRAPVPETPRRPAGPAYLPGVTSVIAVASGKGGVGKSTTAVNLALALAAGGRAVGILDADIFGPSLPTMMGIRRRPASPDGKKIIPIDQHGLRCMSIGFMVPEETPMIWRGPMVMGALEQMLRDVEWGTLDVLVVDMPPGTGDAQLTLSQRVPLAGAVIVSTPQDLALIDARRGLNMFRKVDVPVLGIIENMSYFICPHCGGRSDIFTHGGARKEAERLGVEFLGEIPLDMAIRETADGGTPIVIAAPDSPQAKAYAAIAERIGARLAADGGRAAPRIVVQ
ncbi:MAG: iron-sulfur cluster carrier protein ApbC [Alphaproteobacteria bacterium]|nr:iron-sulfur cluster carrier protein ApbC [Alphaproteobacteria bacterium]